MKSPHSRTQHRHAHMRPHEDTTHGTGHRGWVIQLSQTFWWGLWERRAWCWEVGVGRGGWLRAGGEVEAFGTGTIPTHRLKTSSQGKPELTFSQQGK